MSNSTLRKQFKLYLGRFKHSFFNSYCWPPCSYQRRCIWSKNNLKRHIFAKDEFECIISLLKNPLDMDYAKRLLGTASFKKENPERGINGVVALQSPCLQNPHFGCSCDWKVHLLQREATKKYLNLMNATRALALQLENDKGMWCIILGKLQCYREPKVGIADQMCCFCSAEIALWIKLEILRSSLSSFMCTSVML